VAIRFTLFFLSEVNANIHMNERDVVCILAGCKVENKQVKSRPDPPRFLHLTHPFPFFRKNPGAGRVTGRKLAGAWRKWEGLHPVRIAGIPYFIGMDPDLTRTFPEFSAHCGMAPPHYPFSPSVHHNSQKPNRSPVINPTTHRTKHCCTPFAF
jgi:hypothetical protein